MLLSGFQIFLHTLTQTIIRYINNTIQENLNKKIHP